MTRGSIVKRGSKYAVKVELAPDPRTGRRRQKWHSGYATKRDAEKARTEIMSSLDRGEYVEPTRQTTAQFLEDWLRTSEARVRASTHASYERIIDGHIVPKLGSSPVHKLRPQDIDQLYADLLRSGGRGKRGLSPKTVRNVHIVLHRALADAARRGVLPRNPADHASPPRVEKRDMVTWSAAELRTFLDSIADDPLRAAWLVAATTGMRRGEVLGLRWRDVDLDSGRASITQQLTTVRSRLVTVAPKTASGRRSAALDSTTVRALREHRRAQARQRMAIGNAWPDHDLVFVEADGRPIHPDHFTRMFHQRARRAELPAIRLHDLRHGWATLALQSGVHPKIVSQQLGHATVTITLDIYSHVTPAMTSEAVGRVTAAVFASGGR